VCFGDGPTALRLRPTWAKTRPRPVSIRPRRWTSRAAYITNFSCMPQVLGVALSHVLLRGFGLSRLLPAIVQAMHDRLRLTARLSCCIAAVMLVVAPFSKKCGCRSEARAADCEALPFKTCCQRAAHSTTQSGCCRGGSHQSPISLAHRCCKCGPTAPLALLAAQDPLQRQFEASRLEGLPTVLVIEPKLSTRAVRHADTGAEPLSEVRDLCVALCRLAI
jgi:hypothetical protein